MRIRRRWMRGLRVAAAAVLLASVVTTASDLSVVTTASDLGEIPNRGLAESADLSASARAATIPTALMND